MTLPIDYAALADRFLSQFCSAGDNVSAREHTVGLYDELNRFDFALMIATALSAGGAVLPDASRAAIVDEIKRRGFLERRKSCA